MLVRSFRLVSIVNHSSISKILSFNMNDSSNQVATLIRRLKTASQQANALQKEIADIKKELKDLTEKAEQQVITIDDFDENDFNTAVPEKAPKRTKYDFERDGEFVVAYTDGACENNGKANAKAGIGVWFGDNHPLNVSEPVKGRATNNNAEIQACTAAIRAAKDNNINKVKILTDSQFTINCMTKWIQGWKAKGWKTSSGQDVKNREELVQLDKISRDVDVKYEYIPGHKGHEGNEKADELARLGAREYRNK